MQRYIYHLVKTLCRSQISISWRIIQNNHHRQFFRTLPKIYDGAFFCENSQQLLTVSLLMQSSLSYIFAMVPAASLIAVLLITFSSIFFLKKIRLDSEAVVRRSSVKKGVLRNVAKFNGKHLDQRLFLNNVVNLRTATLLKKSLWHRCFL